MFPSCLWGGGAGETRESFFALPKNKFGKKTNTARVKYQRKIPAKLFPEQNKINITRSGSKAYNDYVSCCEIIQIVRCLFIYLAPNGDSNEKL